jgi:hypothetical protein
MLSDTAPWDRIKMNGLRKEHRQANFIASVRRGHTGVPEPDSRAIEL